MLQYQLFRTVCGCWILLAFSDPVAKGPDAQLVSLAKQCQCRPADGDSSA